MFGLFLCPYAKWRCVLAHCTDVRPERLEFQDSGFRVQDNKKLNFKT